MANTTTLIGPKFVEISNTVLLEHLQQAGRKTNGLLEHLQQKSVSQNGCPDDQKSCLWRLFGAFWDPFGAFWELTGGLEIDILFEIQRILGPCRPASSAFNAVSVEALQILLIAAEVQPCLGW